MNSAITDRPGSATNIPGVHFRRLEPRADSRGLLMEVFRNEWFPGGIPVQWNFVRSEPNVLRGVHVHVRHTDHLLVLSGAMQLGLVDLREGTTQFRKSMVIDLKASEPTVVSIAEGVAHGFFFRERSELLYGVTHYWDPVNDELGCRWDDPDLGLSWCVSDPVLSPRDEKAQSLWGVLEVLRHSKDKSW